MTPNLHPYLIESASQTAGPYVHIGCLPNDIGLPMYGGANLGQTLLSDGFEGARVAVRGRVIDGVGMVMRDAMVECWQADPEGRFPPEAAEGFHGFARSGCDDDGYWRFETVRPGAVPFADGRPQHPHMTLMIFARGINLGLQTRLYWPDVDIDADPALQRIEHRDRRATLVAREVDGGLELDIRLQGEDETVFFDV